MFNSETAKGLLTDMLESSLRAQRHVATLTYEQFLNSEVHQDAIVRCIEITGEAARSVPVEMRDQIDLPWPKITAMRHVLAHDYDAINLETVWRVVQNYVPEMISKLQVFLNIPIRKAENRSTIARHPDARFIVFDGNEGCGKSTQAHLLKEHFERQAREVVFVRDPGTTRIGEEIRHILLNPDHDEMAMRCEMLLYMAARAQMMKEVILPALDAGKIVISDRFVSSTLAYQLGGDGLTADEIHAVGQIAINGRWPDITLILDMPAEVSQVRVKAKFERKQATLFGEETKIIKVKDRIELRPVEYHRTVRDAFLAQAKAYPDSYRVIPADRSPEAVHAEILAAL